MPFLEDWLVAAPWLSMFLNQLKPLLLVMLVSFLPEILTQFSRREGHIAETSLQTSVFFKFSIFLIIQMFFVQMLSGSIMSELQNFIKYPMEIINRLAEAIPQQGGYKVSCCVFIGFSISNNTFNFSTIFHAVRCCPNCIKSRPGVVST